jgi:hypothetical protein
MLGLKLIAHLKQSNSLLQSCPAFLQQHAHFALTQKLFDFATLLLSLNKGM